MGSLSGSSTFINDGIRETPGATSETVDGMSLEKINTIIPTQRVEARTQ